MLDLLGQLRLLPVITIDNPADASLLGRALMDGGLPIAEITFRTPAAQEAIRELAKVPGMTVAAGTVTRPAQVEEALEAGASLILSPGFSLGVVLECQRCGVPVVPGIATATELIACLEAGCSTAKFFPAHTTGGTATLEAFAGPFPEARFVPTGGLSMSDLADYLRLPSVLALGGSWIATRDAIAQHQSSRIAALAAAALTVVDSYPIPMASAVPYPGGPE